MKVVRKQNRMEFEVLNSGDVFEMYGDCGTIFMKTLDNNGIVLASNSSRYMVGGTVSFTRDANVALLDCELMIE